MTDSSEASAASIARWVAALAEASARVQEPPPTVEAEDGAARPEVFGALLDDIDEALSALHVAGIGLPDPEIFDELAELEARARELTMGGLAERLARTAVMIRAVAEADGRGQRDLAARQLWIELQNLVAWTRLGHTEVGLMTVSANLGRSSEVSATPTGDKGQGETMTVYPVGVSLLGAGRVEIHGFDTDGGGSVLMRDTLAEGNDDPLRGRSISRLFQTALPLSEVLGGLILFDDHPCSRWGGRTLFEPHFRAVPQLVAIPSGFEAPKVARFDFDDEGTLVFEERGVKTVDGEIGSLVVDVSRGPDGALFRHFGRTEVPVVGSPTLELNVAKWLLTEGAAVVRSRPTFLARGESVELLSLVHELDGRVFPSADPTCFRIAPEVLARRAYQVAGGLDRPSTAALLRVLADRLGDDRDRIIAGRTALGAVATSSLDEVFEVELASMLTGGDPVTGDLAERVLAALEGIDTGPEPTEPQRLYQAVWLAGLLPLTEELSSALERIFTGRNVGDLRGLAVEDVCARTIMMTLVVPADDEEELDGAPANLRPTSLEAYEFITSFAGSFLTDAALSGARRPLRDIVRFFDATAFALGVERRGALPITVDRMTMAAHCADALLGAFSGNDAPTDLALAAGMDALMALVSGALHPLFLD